MTSCTIIISHYESLPFLRACVRQIRKYAHPEIEQKIVIVDQSGFETLEKLSEYFFDNDIIVIHTLPLYSGHGIDVCMREMMINTEYICQIHVDTIPVSKNWLYLPIKLIEENNLSFVGQLQFVNRKENLASIYPPNPFFAMAQCFNVARTETYKEMSIEAGFTRFHNRKGSGLTFLNDDWYQWAAYDYNNRGSDDDVVAFYWNGKYKTDDMLGLAITGMIEKNFGRIIEGVVFHFCSARESIGVDMGARYNGYTNRINEDYSDSLIEEMVNLAKANKPNNSPILVRNYWNGKTKEVSSLTEELNKRIEELKSTF